MVRSTHINVNALLYARGRVVMGVLPEIIASYINVILPRLFVLR